MRSFTKLTIFTLLLAVLPTAHASVHKADPKVMEFFKLVASSQPQQTSSRKLLAQGDCLQHASSPAAQPFYGECSGLVVNDESHWCDLEYVSNTCDSSNNYCGAGSANYFVAVAYAQLLPTGTKKACIADSSMDCCAPNGGAIAGTVIGCFVGLALIITAFAWCCKCCCFRPKQVVIVQQAAP